MKIKSIMLALCMLIIACVPVEVKAAETTATVGGTLRDTPEIVMLDPQEAARIHLRAQSSGMAPQSDLAMSTISISEGDGKLYVTYTTGSRVMAQKVGARNVTLQQKNGFLWKTIAIRSGYAENTDTYIGGFYLTNPEDGKQYRAECTHYIVVNGQETSGYNETLPHTYSE